MTRIGWLAAFLALVFSACNLPPESGGTLEPERTLTLTLPASGTAYLTLKNASGPVRLFAQSQTPQGAGLRLVVLNTDGNPMYASASHFWFGLPQVAVASLEAAPLIAVEPADGPRLNLNAYPGHDYLVRVENHSGQSVEVLVGTTAFQPQSDGGDALLSAGDTTGALEFVGEVDTYLVPDRGTLSLQASGSGYAWIVADVYASRTTGSPKIATLEPGGPALAVEAGNYVWVRSRGNAAAGFNEPESFQYTLSYSP